MTFSEFLVFSLCGCRGGSGVNGGMTPRKLHGVDTATQYAHFFCLPLHNSTVCFFIKIGVIGVFAMPGKKVREKKAKTFGTFQITF